MLTIHLRHPDADRHLASVGTRVGDHTPTKTRCGEHVARGLTVESWPDVATVTIETLAGSSRCRACPFSGPHPLPGVEAHVFGERGAEVPRTTHFGTDFAMPPAPAKRHVELTADSSRWGGTPTPDSMDLIVNRITAAIREAAAMHDPELVNVETPSGEVVTANVPRPLDHPARRQAYVSEGNGSGRITEHVRHVGTILGRDLWIATEDDDEARRAEAMLQAMAEGGYCTCDAPDGGKHDTSCPRSAEAPRWCRSCGHGERAGHHPNCTVPAMGLKSNGFHR